MNSNLICPACGHSQPESEGLLSRKVRCPACRAVFRVTSSDLKGLIEPRAADPPVQPVAAGSPSPDDSPQAAKSRRADQKPELAAGSAQGATTAKGRRANLPAWAYGALGIAAALMLVGVIVLMPSFKSPTSSQLAEPIATLPRAAAVPLPTQNPAHPQTQTAATGKRPVTPTKPKSSQRRPDETVVARGKNASALVEVSLPNGSMSGTAFCVDKSGLFITNAHVVRPLVEGKGDIRLVIDIGQKTQRSVPARVERFDDNFDLALLKIDADPRLTTLDLGKDETLSVTTPVATFGFPLGARTRVGHEIYPNCSVILSEITELHRDQGRLDSVQFNRQLNPGNSGGPVLNGSGEVVGVAVKTVEGKSVNLAIPVGRLSDFMAAPGVLFKPPILSYEDRSKPQSWSITLVSATAGGKLPEGLSVRVTIAQSEEDRQSQEAKVASDGSCNVSVIPVPRDPQVPVRAIEALVEAKQGSVAVATVHRRIELKGAPALAAAKEITEPQFFILRRFPRYGSDRGPLVLIPAAPVRPVIRGQCPSDDGLLTVKELLNVNGQTRGAGKSIRPPNVPMGEAKIGAGFGGLRKAWSVTLEQSDTKGGPARPWRIANLAVSADGRRLVAGLNREPDHRRLIAGLDGRSVAGLDDCEVRVWDATSGRLLHALSGHQGEVNAVAISPDGRRALSGGTDMVLRLWDLDSGKLLNQYEAGDPLRRNDQRRISLLAFTPDGRRAVQTMRDTPVDDVRVRDLDTGKVVAQLNSDPHLDGQGIFDLAVSPDGRFVLSSAHQSAQLWNLETGQRVARFPGRSVNGTKLIFSPDGKSVIVSSSGSHLFRVLELPTGRELRAFGPPAEHALIDCFAVSPDGRIVVSRNTVGVRSLTIWDVRSGKLLGTTSDRENGMGRRQLVGGFAPGGRRVFWYNAGDSICEYVAPEPERDASAPREGSEPLTRGLSSPIEDLVVGGGGRYLCLKLKGPELAIFDVNAADVKKTIKLSSDNALIAAGGEFLVAVDPDHVPATVERWSFDELAAEGMKATLPIRGRVRGLAMGSDSDGPLVVVWAPHVDERSAKEARFSFLDPKTFAVLKAGPITNITRSGNPLLKWGGVSPSGGSIVLDDEPHGHLLHVRASAGGNLYGIWESIQFTNQPIREHRFFQSLAIQGASLKFYCDENTFGAGLIVPGLDGRTVYTGRGGIRDSEGKRVGLADESSSASTIVIPSNDPAYYLGVESDHAMVYGTDPSERLCSVLGLDEMASRANDQASGPTNLTVEKRFHLIPAANLLITIPFSNDKLVLRRLEVAKAGRQARGAK
jgi:WD40 repeat protein/S1-C subfamily serine protease